MNNEITNAEDIIDSRDIIARIEELESEREALATNVSDYEQVISDVETAEENEEPVSVEDREGYNEAVAQLDNAKDALEDWDASDEAEELKLLQAFAKECENDVSEWEDGATLIRESYFQTYAQELAEDIGAIDKNAQWPLRHIDWEAAADELKQDYSEVDFDGVPYLARN